jgi:hypothetical protein
MLIWLAQACVGWCRVVVGWCMLDPDWHRFDAELALIGDSSFYRASQHPFR